MINDDENLKMILDLLKQFDMFKKIEEVRAQALIHMQYREIDFPVCNILGGKLSVRYEIDGVGPL